MTRTQVRRVPPADELERDGELLVLIAARAVRVAGVGPMLLALTAEWCSVEELVEELVARFGAPPSGTADDVVRVALEDLQASGLVEVRHVE